MSAATVDIDVVARIADEQVVCHRDVVDRPEIVLDEDIGGIAADDRVVLDEDPVLVALDGDAVIVRIGAAVVEIVNVVARDGARTAGEDDAVLRLRKCCCSMKWPTSEDAGIAVGRRSRRR